MSKMTEDRANGWLLAAVIGAMFLAVVWACRAAPGDTGSAYKGPVAPFKQVISTTAVKVLPERGGFVATEFAAGTVYTQGRIVKAGIRMYMCVATNSAGTAGTNTPSWATGEGSDGTDTWRAFPSGPRKGWVLYNAGTNEIKIGYGVVPTSTTGASILNGGTWYEDQGDKQAAVYAIGTGTATNGLITGVEL